MQAANEWGSDGDSVLKSDSAYDSHSTFSEFRSCIFVSNSTRAAVGWPKGPLESDHTCFENSQITGKVTLNCWM